MVYTDTAAVRLLTNLTTNDISNADVTSIISYATTTLNAEINTDVIRERILWLDNTRRNQIDGTNAVYYTRNWRGKFLGDSNNDGDVDTSDVTVYQVASDGTETTLTISAIDVSESKITLSSAPASGVRLFITYNWCYKNPNTPDSNIKLAATYLTASLIYEKLNRGLSPEQVYGNVRFRRDMMAGNEYYIKYNQVITRINSKADGEWTQGSNAADFSKGGYNESY